MNHVYKRGSEMLEKDIKTILKDEGPMPMDDLREYIETTPFELRQAVWNLVDRGEIEFTENRELKSS